MGDAERGLTLVNGQKAGAHGHTATGRGSARQSGGVVALFSIYSATKVHFHNTLPSGPHTQPRPPTARVHHSYRWKGEGRVLIWPSRRSRRS